MSELKASEANKTIWMLSNSLLKGLPIPIDFWISAENGWFDRCWERCTDFCAMNTMLILIERSFESDWLMVKDGLDKTMALVQSVFSGAHPLSRETFRLVSNVAMLFEENNMGSPEAVRDAVPKVSVNMLREAYALTLAKAST